MKPSEWFRQTHWNPEIEAAFEARLCRSRTARNRAQYLRIQGLTLIETRVPELMRIGMRLTLRVLAEYADAKFEISQCHHTLGRAYERLGELESAISSYRKAWEYEKSFPTCITGARLELAKLLVLLGRKADADKALAAIDSGSTGLADFFPRALMTESLVRACVASWRGDPLAASTHARTGLEAAEKTRSPMRYHPNLGLSTSEDAAIIEALKRLADQQT